MYQAIDGNELSMSFAQLACMSVSRHPYVSRLQGSMMAAVLFTKV